MKRILIATLMLLTLLTLQTLQTQTTHAQGIIIPEPPICRHPCPIPPPPPREVPYLTVESLRVDVTIDNQVATTHVEQVFRNDSQWSLEGTYIFPLPEEAAINDFAMWINGDRVEGQLYTKEEARQIYDNIVRRRLDPALLEYVGRDLFQASIFPIEPGDTRRVELEYTQILPVDNGLVQYVHPLTAEKFSQRPLESVAITVNVTSNDAIKAIYSPSHPVSIDRDGRFSALAGWEDFDVRPTSDFSLFYSVSPDDIGVNLLSTKERDEDGFFTLLIAPNVEAEQIVDKDVTLVLDVSGSMEGEKMEQARDALKYVLDNLNEGDRFNIIAFSTGVRAFSTQPEPISKVAEARRFVDNLRPEGSTDINRALLEAIDSADSERPTIVIFLTDGLPTSGTTETPLIVNNIEQAAGSNLRIFPFGVGDDVDTVLLDTLAQRQRGTSAYVRPGERVDEKVSGFYAKVSTPVLADITLDVAGVQLEDTYPYPLPDLFAGSQLIVTGRYRDGGPATVTLTGDVNGQAQTYTFDDLTFASSPRQNAEFVPRLWATRKVGYLLNQVRLNGENRETIDEIVNLSVRYGIITPYTSFLVEEPEMALSREGRDMIAQEEFAAAAEAPADVSGGSAVSKAVDQNAMADAEMAAPIPMLTATPGVGGEMDADGVAALPSVMTVGSKAFVLKDGIWTDTAYDPTLMTTTSLPFPSEEFLDFLTANPDAGQYFALGSNVIVVIDGAAYETVEGEVDEIPERLTNDEAEAKAEVKTQAEAEPNSVEIEPASHPANAVTSAKPANAADIYTTITADMVQGAAPLVVNFRGDLVGGADDNQDFYCVESTFDFGDGHRQSQSPSCVAWKSGAEILRSYVSNYVYEAPGEYQVTFQLGQAASEPVTIVVTAGDAEPEPATPADDESEAAAKAVDPTPLAETTTTAVDRSSCLSGLLLLPLLALVIGLRRGQA
ncbi:MAG: VWA domain-containing protein [Anaerolineaceae bacterium]|nr:VWA domain-containing protein [Anaerolineaceae bacterium]